MCVSPIRIKNPVKGFDPVKAPYYVDVPCGHCYECISLKRNEWITRSLYEWQQCRDNGGFAGFLTLTYSDIYLPRINGLLPCFSKRDVQTYLKRCRKSLQTNLGVNLRYLITSELGEKYNRPHYHALFFFESTNKCFLDETLQDRIYKIMVSQWYYGNTQVGCDGFIVNRVTGIQYVTKYITKQNEDSDYIKKIRDSIIHGSFPVFSVSRETFSLEGLSADEQLNVLTEVADKIKCRHYQSKGFGSYILDSLDDTLIKNLTCKIPSNDEIKTVPLPQYIVRKLLYKRIYSPDKHTCVYRLSRFGIQNRLESLHKAIDTLSDKLIMALEDITEDMVFSLNSKIGAEFDSIDALWKFFIDKLGIRTFHDLAIYIKVYRFHGFSQHDIEFYNSHGINLFSKDVIEKFFLISHPVQLCWEDVPSSSDIDLQRAGGYINCIPSYMLPEFEYFEQLAQIILNVLNLKNSCKTNKMKNEEDIAKRLKNYYNSL